jgi:hypothetical protein
MIYFDSSRGVWEKCKNVECQSAKTAMGKMQQFLVIVGCFPSQE